jgi:hypothetical protein
LGSVASHPHRAHREEGNNMAKQGQHHGDARDSDKSRGPDRPSKSVTITTGTYKKPETYTKQALAGEDPAAPAQAAKRRWNPDTRDKPTIEGSTRARKGSVGARDERKQFGPKAVATRKSGYVGT